MSVSTVNSGASDDDVPNPTPTVYKYDLRLEISVKNDGETVPVVAIFYDLVRRLKDAADEGAPVAVLTATDKLFHENKEMTSDEFQKAFQVDNFNGKAAKVVLGFKIRSMTRLSELKRRLMHTYLIPRNLYLRQHAGGFQNGVKTFNFGFLQNDHPDHPDIKMLNQRFARITTEAWKKLDKDDRKKWKQDLPSSIFESSGIVLPINFTKERITATMEDKEKISTYALMVSIPSKYGKLMKTLLDKAIAAKRLNNLIPFALSRDSPKGYYYIVASQARFIDAHRNIPILNVPVESLSKPGIKGVVLSEVLNAHSAIQRVAYDHQQHKYHVSTIATKYREVHQWISSVLEEHNFPYAPYVRPMKFSGGNGSSPAVTYSDVFKSAISLASDNYTASTTTTTQSNAWKTRPPLAISYSLTDAVFPPLTPTKAQVPTTPSTTSETCDEDTIQSAISVAIKKLEEQHRAELLQLKKEMQSKIDEVTSQMKELGQQVATQTYQALVNKESPLATKTDHAQLQHDMTIISTQLNTIIGMFKTGSQAQLLSVQEIPTQNSSNDTDSHPSSPSRHPKRSKRNMTPEKLDRQFATYTQDCSVSSAASDSEESMEGCEE